VSTPRSSGLPARLGGREPAQLADVLERVLDKGIVIAGDIQINLLDIELLTIKLRLLIASADKAKEMGIDWWQGDPFLAGRQLEDRIKRLESEAGIEPNGGSRREVQAEDERQR
jgi:hypothetical protein